jgi:hypothetical protein
MKETFTDDVRIYIIRAGITAYYDYRTDSITTRLEEQQAERTKTIEKLKAATKYDSTQVLLEKYGGATPKPKKPSAPKAPKAVPKQSGRVSIGAPPPTANIGRPEHIPSQPSTPQPQPVMRPPPPRVIPSPASPQPSAEFAPNAFSAPPQYAQPGDVNAGGNWYDRILDLLMGEDETLPKNRVALICQNCRLINGQAPPGTRSLEELGKWRCFGCGSMNGEEDEATKVVKEIKERLGSQEEPSSPEIVKVEDVDSGDGKEPLTDESGEMIEAADLGEDTVEVKQKRGRPKGNKKKA